MTVIDAKPKPSVREQLAEKQEAGECLHCGDPAKVRGLCQKHYLQFMAARNAIPERERAAFEAKQIRDGKIARPHQGRRGSKNPFKSDE